MYVTKFMDIKNPLKIKIKNEGKMSKSDNFFFFWIYFRIDFFTMFKNIVLDIFSILSDSNFFINYY